MQTIKSFVFDEVDAMPAGVFESVVSLLDHNKHVDGVDYRQAIFIFLTNTGGKQILHALMDEMQSGTYRERTKLEDFKFIAESAAFNIGGSIISWFYRVFSTTSNVFNFFATKIIHFDHKTIK